MIMIVITKLIADFLVCGFIYKYLINIKNARINVGTTIIANNPTANTLFIPFPTLVALLKEVYHPCY